MEQHASAATAYLSGVLMTGSHNNGFSNDEEDLLPSEDRHLSRSSIISSPRVSAASKHLSAILSKRHHRRDSRKHGSGTQSATSSPYINNYRPPQTSHSHSHSHNYNHHGLGFSSQSNTPTKISKKASLRRHTSGTPNKSNFQPRRNIPLNSDWNQPIWTNGQSHFNAQRLLPTDLDQVITITRQSEDSSGTLVARTNNLNGFDFVTDGNTLVVRNSDSVKSLWTVMYDYEAQGEDELSLRHGELVEVLSKDSKISGDEGLFCFKLYLFFRKLYKLAAIN